MEILIGSIIVSIVQFLIYTVCVDNVIGVKKAKSVFVIGLCVCVSTFCLNYWCKNPIIKHGVLIGIMFIYTMLISNATITRKIIVQIIYIIWVIVMNAVIEELIKIMGLEMPEKTKVIKDLNNMLTILKHIFVFYSVQICKLILNVSKKKKKKEKEVYYCE